MGKMEDSILGEGCVQRWLPARQEGTEMTAFRSLEVLGAGWSPAAQEGSGGAALFIAQTPQLGSALGPALPLLCPDLPTRGLVPTPGFKRRKRPRSSGWRCGGQRGRGLGGPRVAPGGPTVPQPGGVPADFAQPPAGAPRTRRPQAGPAPTAGPWPAGLRQRVGAGIAGRAQGCF